MANRNPMCDRIFSGQGVVCSSEEETRALGRELAEHIAVEATLSLEGALGAGKTCFVKGLAEGLGLDRAMVSPVASPDSKKWIRNTEKST